MTTSTLSSQVLSLQRLSKITYGILPIVAGADKFTNLLCHWADYLAPGLRALSPFSPDTSMMVIGVIEIIAGILVLSITRVGAYVVAAWLLAIACTLIFSGTYLDVAVRDIVMAIGAYILARLTGIVETKEAPLN